MKNLILTVSIIFALNSCSQSNEINNFDNSIYGTWHLTKRTANNVDVTASEWENVSNGFIITFNNDFKYESNESTICQNNLNEGIFSLSKVGNSTNDVVEIIISNFDNNSNGTFVRSFYYSFNENDLILTSKDPSCDEGCAFLYRRE